MFLAWIGLQTASTTVNLTSQLAGGCFLRHLHVFVCRWCEADYRLARLISSAPQPYPCERLRSHCLNNQVTLHFRNRLRGAERAIGAFAPNLLPLAWAAVALRSGFSLRSPFWIWQFNCQSRRLYWEKKEKRKKLITSFSCWSQAQGLELKQSLAKRSASRALSPLRWVPVPLIPPDKSGWSLLRVIWGPEISHRQYILDLKSLENLFMLPVF